jgi:tRNA-Thr(GGU) m(6)t(6)A37 methyltransferase TsaA
MKKVTYTPIGIIHSPYKEPRGTPIQVRAAADCPGEVEVYPAFAGGLRDLDGFSHIMLIYHFHLSKDAGLLQEPFMDTVERGIFSIRSPSRPNPIGVSVVRLCGVEGNRLEVRGLDIVDGTPLLDIKPYVPEFDAHETDSIGWLEGNIGKMKRSRDDGRFTD